MIYKSSWRRVNFGNYYKSSIQLILIVLGRFLHNKNKINTMDHEMYLRDDLINFSNQLNSQGYNVKNYRKKKSTVPAKYAKKSFLSTEHQGSQNLDIIRVDKSVQRTQRTTEVVSTQRLSSTAAVRRRSHVNDANYQGFTRTAMSKHNSGIEESCELVGIADRRFVKSREHTTIQQSQQKQADQVKSSFAKLEKKYCKNGELKEKHLQNWLNQILVEYCHDQKFDPTIQNSALKKFGIDKNSLLSKGVKPDCSERIFKSLFVYSMGFNTLLKEITQKNMNLRKTVWKVYAILLEYCSNGDFQTMIGEIQRDKAKKLQKLKGEIQKRQEIIQNNEEINQEKNAKIFKELKILREENINLENDKIVLMQDYKQAEQAFNQEVSLRLRFQNKINEIHGVHRELTIKHQRLYQDLQIKINQITNCNDKYNKLSEKYLCLKNENQFLQKQHEETKKQNKYNLQLVGEMKQQFKQFQLREIEFNSKRNELISVIKQKQRKIGQVRTEQKNVEAMLHLRQQSCRELQKQYERSLEQNRKLNQTIHSQANQLGDLFLDKKNFNEKHSSIYAQIEILKFKVESKQKQVEKLKMECKELIIKYEQQKILTKIVQSKFQMREKDLQDCYAKMDEMKKIKNILEDDLHELKKKDELYKIYYVQKQKMIEELTQKIEQLENDLSNANIYRKNLESKILMLTQKNNAEEQINKKRIDKLKYENKQLSQQHAKMKQALEIKSQQLQKSSLQLQEIYVKLKDQIFERSDLDLRYKQSLCVVESQTDHIKNLNINISELQERIEQHLRKIRSLEYIIQGKQKSYQTEISLIKKTNDELRDQIKNYRYYIHPIKYEDAISHLQRIQQKNTKLSIEIRINQKSSQNNKQENDQKLRNAYSQIEFLKQEMADKLLSKNRQIDYLKQAQINLKEKLKNIEDSLSATNVEGKTSHTFLQKQKRYLEVIKQKSSKIQNLLQQVQRIQDHSNHLLKRINQVEKQLIHKNERLMSIDQEKMELLNERGKILIEKAEILREKESIKSRLEEFQNHLLQQNSDRHNINSGHDSRNNSHPRNSSPLEKNRDDISKVNNPAWRQDFTKKMRNAYNYYNK